MLKGWNKQTTFALLQDLSYLSVLIQSTTIQFINIFLFHS